MKRRRCRACGELLDQGETVCPNCGTRAVPEVSRIWVLAFFVMGILIGLLLWVLQREAVVPVSDSVPPPPATAPQTKARAKPPQADKPVKAVAPPRKPSSPRVAKPAGGSTVGKGAEAGQKPTAPLVEASGETYNCDRKDAREVYDRARTLGVITQQQNAAEVRLNDNWAYYLPGHRSGFVRAFAAADRCLHGPGRSLRFVYRDQVAATVSADGEIEMK